MNQCTMALTSDQSAKQSLGFWNLGVWILGAVGLMAMKSNNGRGAKDAYCVAHHRQLQYNLPFFTLFFFKKNKRVRTYILFKIIIILINLFLHSFKINMKSQKLVQTSSIHEVKGWTRSQKWPTVWLTISGFNRTCYSFASQYYGFKRKNSF